MKPSLLAKFVGCDPFKMSMTLYRNSFASIGVDGVITSFPEQIEAVLLEILNQFTPFDRH